MSIKPFQFPVRRVQGVQVKPPTQPKPERQAQDALPVILGSNLEAWAYRSLLELGWPKDDITLQRSIYGGRTLPGGQIVDIVLYKPTSCAISLKGKRFHGNSGEETIDDARIAQIYDEYVVIWDYETPTYEAMVNVIEARVGRP